jgi:hypothetical protein
MVAAQRDEIARLKGLKGRPSIKPSGMEAATEPKAGGNRAKRQGRGKVTPCVTPETKELRVAVPQGSKFKGYELYRVQDLVLSARWCATAANVGRRRKARRSWRRCPAAFAAISARNCGASC